MGISFAIPMDEAMRVSNQLKVSGKVSRGRIGVAIAEVCSAGGSGRANQFAWRTRPAWSGGERRAKRAPQPGWPNTLFGVGHHSTVDVRKWFARPFRRISIRGSPW